MSFNVGTISSKWLSLWASIKLHNSCINQEPSSGRIDLKPVTTEKTMSKSASLDASMESVFLSLTSSWLRMMI